MKAFFRYSKPIFVLTALLSMGLLGASCSDDEGGTDVQTPPLQLEGIILNPKAADPGDTVQVTVVIRGSEATGFPTIKWQTIGGGRFVDDDEMSVKWIAPSDTSGVFRLKVTVTNAVGSKSWEADVFVGKSEVIVPRHAGEMHLWNTQTDLYYLRSSIPVTQPIAGFRVYEYTGGSYGDATPGPESGLSNVFAPDLSTSAFTVRGVLQAGDLTAPINLWVNDLVGGEQIKVTFDAKDTVTEGAYHDQFKYPKYSLDSELIAYEALRAYPFVGGGVDTFDVEVFDVDDRKSVNVTESIRGRRSSFLPSFSSDGNWFVFVSDRGGLNQWELYALPVENGAVVTDSAETIRVTDTGGVIAGGTRGNLTRPTLLWNPNSSLSILAIVANDGRLRFVKTDASGATTTPVNGISTGTISEMIWSPDGQLLAVSAQVKELLPDGSESTTNALYIVTTSGVATIEHETPVSDRIRDLAWSPLNDAMVCRMSRGTSCWLELIDLEGDAGFLKPLVITRATNIGNLVTYRNFMSTKSLYNSSDVIYYLLFNGETASINTLDVSKAIR